MLSQDPKQSGSNNTIQDPAQRFDPGTCASLLTTLFSSSGIKWSVTPDDRILFARLGRAPGKGRMGLALENGTLYGTPEEVIDRLLGGRTSRAIRERTVPLSNFGIVGSSPIDIAEIELSAAQSVEKRVTTAFQRAGVIRETLSHLKLLSQDAKAGIYGRLKGNGEHILTLEIAPRDVELANGTYAIIKKLQETQAKARMVCNFGLGPVLLNYCLLALEREGCGSRPGAKMELVPLAATPERPDEIPLKLKLDRLVQAKYLRAHFQERGIETSLSMGRYRSPSLLFPSVNSAALITVISSGLGRYLTDQVG